MKKILLTIGVLLLGGLGWLFYERPEPPFGAVGDELIRYPIAVDTDQERLEFSIRAEELLRLHHNVKGEQYRDGKITKAQFEKYLSNFFIPRSRRVSAEAARVRDALGIKTIEQVNLNKTQLESYKTSTIFDGNIDLNIILK